MPLSLVVDPPAEQDVQAIYDYISERSPDGARRWYQAFLNAAHQAVRFPQSYPLAPEDTAFDAYEIRNFLFRTRRGNVYRGIFVILGSELRVLRVRGQGQPPMKNAELRID